jgi:steroid delta-isomerase-like uncharacterized protein
MSIEENKNVIRRYLAEVWNKKNVTAIDQFAAPTYRRYLSPLAEPLSGEGQKQRLSGLWAAFPDAQLSIEDLFADGDRVALRSVLRGTHLGTFQGIPPTGKQVTVAVLDTMRIENGKMVEHWGGPDIFNLLQQLGGVVSAGGDKK